MRALWCIVEKSGVGFVMPRFHGDLKTYAKHDWETMWGIKHVYIYICIQKLTTILNWDKFKFRVSRDDSE